MKKTASLLLAFAGTLVASALSAQARVQVIHNCADAAASTVDVWINDQLLLNDFAFRTSSPYVNAPAGVPLDITICGPASTDTTAEVARFTVTFQNNATYAVVANGIVSSSGYSPVQPFTLDVYPTAREAALLPGNTDVLVCHGSTDAPVVDVVAPFIATLTDNLAYGAFSSYLQLPTADYPVQIRNQAGTDVVAEYTAPLQTLNLAGQSITVVASGFLNPMMNSNGPAFGLWAATAAGGPLVQLPSAPVSTARVQVIHNSADAAAASVDVWLNSDLLLDNFAFRTASPFVDAPANVPFDVTICGPSSTDTTAEVARFTYTLSGGSKYILVADGIVSPSGYSPATPFSIEVYGSALETASQQTNTDILVHHGCTDAPVVDVEEAFSGSTLVNDLAYSDFAGYLSLPSNANYAVSVTDASGSTVVASYAVPLQTLMLGGNAITVVASGFLDPMVNSNGPSFGLWVATSAGGALIPLPVVTGENETEAASNMNLYPNPVSQDILTLEFDQNQNETVIIRVTDMQGRIVSETNTGTAAAGPYRTTIDVSSFAAGIYNLQLISGDSVSQKRFNVVR